MNRTQLRKKQQKERMELVYEMESTTNPKKLATLQKQLLDQTNRHRAEKEGRIMPKLTVEQYKAYEKQGLSVKDIAKRAGMTVQGIYSFRSTNGLVKPKERLNTPVNTNKTVSTPTTEEKSEINRIDEAKTEIPAVKIPTSPSVNTIPTIETDWSPVQNTVSEYFEKKERNKARIAHGVDTTEVIDSDTHDKLIEQQYKIEELERTVTLWKDRSKEADKRFFDLSEENRKLDKDFRDLYRENQRLQGMLDKSKRLRLLNYLLMKENTDLIDQAEVVAEEKEVDNTWR